VFVHKAWKEGEEEKGYREAEGKVKVSSSLSSSSSSPLAILFEV